MEPALKKELLEIVERLPPEKQARVLEFTRSLAPSPESAVARGHRLAEALDRAAALGGVTSIADPSAWQREQRQDRPLLGRG